MKRLVPLVSLRFSTCEDTSRERPESPGWTGPESNLWFCEGVWLQEQSCPLPEPSPSACFQPAAALRPLISSSHIWSRTSEPPGSWRIPWELQSWRDAGGFRSETFLPVGLWLTPGGAAWTWLTSGSWPRPSCCCSTLKVSLLLADLSSELQVVETSQKHAAGLWFLFLNYLCCLTTVSLF